MNKTNVMILASIAAVGVIGGIYWKNVKIVTPMPEATESDVKSAERVPQEPTPQQQMEQDVNEQVQTPASAVKYNLDKATVKYIAQKRFFSKPNLEVVGTSEDVNGRGWFDKESKTGNVEVSLKFDTIKTPEASRDKDIQSRLSTQDVKLSASLNDLNIEYDKPFEVDVPADVSINGVTKKLIFKVKGSLNADMVSAKGSTRIKMSEFAIDPPSLLNIYTVDDEIGLEFDLKGVKE